LPNRVTFLEVFFFCFKVVTLLPAIVYSSAHKYHTSYETSSQPPTSPQRDRNKPRFDHTSENSRKKFQVSIYPTSHMLGINLHTVGKRLGFLARGREYVGIKKIRIGPDNDDAARPPNLKAFFWSGIEADAAVEQDLSSTTTRGGRLALTWNMFSCLECLLAQNAT
jgi:hypothetical protein